MLRKKSKHSPPPNRKLAAAQTQQPLRRSLRIAGSFLLLVLIIAGIVHLRSPATLPLRHISVRGDYHYLPRQAVRELLHAHLKQGFFQANIDQVQQQLLSLPWVVSADVRKIWPDRLVVTLSEQKAFARWGTNSVMNVDGNVFTPNDINSIPNHLPQFTAPIEQAPDVFRAYKRMNKQLKPLKLHIVDISVSPRLSWKFILSNGIVVTIGREKIFARLQRLIDVYPKIVGDKAQEIVSIDLRYSDGLTVKWQKNKKQRK